MADQPQNKKRSNKDASPPAREAHHGVQFYDSTEYLCSSVSLFATLGFDNNESVMLIATTEHCQLIEQRLLSLGIDIAERKQSGHLVMHNAAELVHKFMVNDMPSRDLFMIVVTELLDKGLSNNPSGVRVYGEMVDVLLREGNLSAAVALERLWNELAHSRVFSLLCGYAMSQFNSKQHSVAFGDICKEHAQVMPTERFEELRSDVDAQRRLIAQLQQQALSLQTEVVQHRATELELRRAEAELRKQNKAPCVTCGTSPH